MKQRLWRVAAAGNAAALLWLMLVLVSGSILFEPLSPPVRLSTPSAPCSARTETVAAGAARVVVIVVDGLRAELARQDALMPTVARLAREGGSGIALVETLLPSTVAAIHALAGGVLAPPLSFLEDFSGRPAREGGVFARVRACGGRTFVAGPSLWRDVYGDWLNAAVTVEGIGERDERVLQAGMRALSEKRHHLTVIHFSRPDDMAHRYGAESPEYVRAVQWCDSAIARLLGQIDSTTAVLVTSDHGVTRQGGHAGPELTVRRTPLVTWGPGLPLGTLGAMRQRELPFLVLQALHIPLPSRLDSIAPPTFSFVSFLKAVARPAAALLLIAVLCAFRLWRAVAHELPGGQEATVLNAVLWASLVLIVCQWRNAALLLLTVTFGVIALRVPAPCDNRPLLAFLLGIGFGVLRLLDGQVTSQYEGMPSLLGRMGVAGHVGLLAVWPGIAVLLLLRNASAAAPVAQSAVRAPRATPLLWLLLTVSFVAYGLDGARLVLLTLLSAVLGWGVGVYLFTTRSAGAVGAGVLCACLPVAAARLAGETVSLSTLDVRMAFQVAEGMWGLPGAVAVVIARHALLIAACVSGLAMRFGALAPRVVGQFAAGLAAALLGQGCVAAALLCLPDVSPALGSLALGLLLHVFHEITFSFLFAALALWLSAPAQA